MYSLGEKISEKLYVSNYKQLLQYLIKKGKKNKLENLFRKNVCHWSTFPNKKFEFVLEKAFLYTIPFIGVKTKRKGSKNIYIPVKLTSRKGKFLSAKWIITAGTSKKKRNFLEGILEELIESSLQKSSSTKKRNDLHKLAEESLVNLR
jgi:ribosomal protein S7